METNNSPLSCETVSVSWVARRLRVHNCTVNRYLEAGVLKGYRLRKGGWWRILKSSVLELETKIRTEMG